MMHILAHRGMWFEETEKNSKKAFKRAFDFGFGAELDIRDYKGKLVVSHDIPDQTSMHCEDFFEIYKNSGANSYLALNIKADGLQAMLKELLGKYEINNYFVFDMSIPDLLGYVRNGLNIFTRQSEYETTPLFLEESEGVWLDEFNGHWINNILINEYVKQNKHVCIVSPELHKRNYTKEWEEYKKITMGEKFDIMLMLCTDYPEKAEEFFNG